MFMSAECVNTQGSNINKEILLSSAPLKQSKFEEKLNSRTQ